MKQPSESKYLPYRLLDEALLARTFGRQKDGSVIVPTASHNNCGSRCVIRIHIKDGNITGLSTDSCTDTPQNPQIRACLKGRSYLDTFLSPERILYPMKRAGKRGQGRFTRISWEEAISTIASEMTRIKQAYGPAARYCNYATGYEMCAASPSVMIRRLLALDGGYLGYYNNYSCSASDKAAKLMYGTNFTGNSRSDYVNSRLIILWGANPAETFCGGNTMYSLLAAKRAGARIVVIDPRYSDTAAALADQWIAPLPTTDCAMADAMAYVIYTKGLHRQDFLDTYCLGFDSSTLPRNAPFGSSYLDYLLGHSDGVAKTPAWAARICGVEAAVIEELALSYAAMQPAAILEGYGPNRHAYGEQFSRCLITLACMAGSLGIPGGSAAGLGQVPCGTWEMNSHPGLMENPFPGKIPCYCWTDCIRDASSFTPENGLLGVDHLDSNIKFIFNLAGNCLINQHGDINHTASLLEDPSQVECIVCSDIFMTPSARFADILLPGTTMLETENITASPARFDDFFKINPVIHPVGDCRFDYDWICEVAGKLGLKEAFSQGKTLHQWLCDCIKDLQTRLPDFPDYQLFTKQGVYKRNISTNIIAFQKQIADPAHFPFETPSGRIEIYVPALARMQQPELWPIPGYRPAWEGPADPLAKAFPLQCIGHHTKARTHSVHHNNPKLQALVPQALWIHPQDAAARSIGQGDKIYVYNNRGTVLTSAYITERIRPGVVSLPQGAWYAPDEAGIDCGGCINTLTSLRTTPIAKANPQHTNLVEVRLAGADGCPGPNVPTVPDPGMPGPNSSTNADSGALPRHSTLMKPETNPSHRSKAPQGCTGCLTCVAACPFGRMQVQEAATENRNLPVIYRPLSCGACKEPACAAACPLRIL